MENNTTPVAPPRKAALVFIFITVLIDILAFGLILFIPTRGALRRPEELEADAYDPDPDARDAGTDAPAE